MRDLTAQVTSSLLHFPEKTLRALGEDDITPGSVLYGKFSGGRNDLAWLARGPRLEVVNSVTGEWLSAWRFTGTHEEPPTIRVVKEFSWKSKTGLLVGLEEAKGSVLCLYDLGIARVVKAVVLPGKVVAVEPIANCGGPSVYTQHLHQSMRWLFGVVAVATDIGHLFLLDLCLDYFSWIPNEIKALNLKFATTFPEEVAQRRETTTREGRHLCFQLEDPSGTAISMLHYISRSNHLVVGFSDGCLSLWNMETLKREHHYQLEGERIPVYAVTFQEPENDPKNRCYLWAVQSTQESGRGVLSLHLVQLTFSRQNHLASGQVMYEGLECCQERFSLDLADGILPLRGQTSHMKLLSCQTIEDFEGDVGREDSAQKVTSPHTSVSVFTWQVNTCGQEKPSTYLGVFDINNWYDAQMPDSLRLEEFLPSCPYFALWSLDTVTSMATPNPILDILVHQPSLTWEAPPSYLPPEQVFNASGYNFDAVCLLSSGVVHISFTGFQKEEEQLEAMVSVAAETGSFKLLTGCIKHWISERTPDSAANLQFICDCAWNKVVYTKDDFDRICAPLFDGSCKFIDPQMLQSLREDHSLLSNLSTVLHCFQREQQELPEEGFADLANKQLLASNYSLYAKVVTWFCKFILPVVSDETMHSSTHFYNYPLLQTFYTDRRQKLSRGNQHSDCLKIDKLVYQSGDHVAKLWQRDGGTGQYPPPNLHALLDVYLLESVDEIYKHGITIYFLEDIFHSLPTKPEFLVKWFATAFAVPQNIFLLIQQFWIMDHGDYKRDGSTCLTEGAATTYSMLDYSGKVLPKTQRKLAAQKAKPYSWLLSLLREGRNTCLTLIRQAKGRNVCTGATTSANILSRLQKHARKTSRPSGSHSAPEKHPYKKSNRTANHKMSSP